MGQACQRRMADKQAVVVVLGLKGSGKTTYTYQLSLGTAVATVPTIGMQQGCNWVTDAGCALAGFNVEDVVKYGIVLNFWDVGGEPMVIRMSRCTNI